MKNILMAACGLAVLLSSCSERKSESAAPSTKEAVMAAPATAAPAPASDEQDAAAEVAGSARPATPAVPAARLLIYHADLRLKVPSLPRTSRSLDSLVHRHGGYLSAATEAHEEGEWRQDMTIRVLPAHFQPLLAALGGMGTVEAKKLTTDDVTAQHADIAARLRTKRAVEQRYVALLASAKKISEVLEVESKIGEVREEIESTESRLKALNDEVAYSTISLTCYQPLVQPVHDAPIISFASRLADSFYTGWSLLTGLCIGAVAIWPLLLLGGAAWFAVRRWRRVAPKAPPAVSQSERRPPN